MKYDILTPRKIVFGWGRRSEVGNLARPLGRRAWIVSGSRTLANNGTIAELQQHLTAAGVESELLATVTREPEVADVDDAVARLVEAGLREDDFLLGIGGGAGLDTAKAVAALAVNRHGTSVRDFLEGVGLGLTLDHDPLPMLAIPTTAGTGTEATKNAVISSYDPPFKKSLRHDRLMPTAVLVDPELTVTCPPTVTAHSGMDAITQLIESRLSCRATYFTNMICDDALNAVFHPGDPLQPTEDEVPCALLTAYDSPEDRDARTRMAHAALTSGIALANSGLGMAHGVAAALGVHCRVSHGLACAALLPIALKANGEATKNLRGVGATIAGPNRLRLRIEAARSDGWEQLIRNVATDAMAEIERINARLGIPTRLSDLGVTADQIPAIVQSSRGNSMNGNPRPLTDEQLSTILTDNL